MTFQSFSFGRGDDEIGGPKKRFKGQEGMRYRVSFPWWEGIDDGKPNFEADGPEFVGAKRNYIQGVGYVLNKGPEYTKLANGESPRTAIATILVVWPMNSKGKLDKEAIANGDIDVCPWVFSQDKYRAIEPIHREFHLGAHDLTINCSDTTYQKMTFSPCKDSIMAKLAEKGGKVWQKIVEETQVLAGSIRNEIGRDMSIKDIREKLQGGGQSGGNPAAVASGVMATEDIDNLVDDLLDDDDDD
jgi:hypothetical protein